MSEMILENSQNMFSYLDGIKEKISSIDRILISTINELRKEERKPRASASLILAYQDKINKLESAKNTLSGLLKNLYENIIEEEVQQETQEQVQETAQPYASNISYGQQEAYEDYNYEASYENGSVQDFSTYSTDMSYEPTENYVMQTPDVNEQIEESESTYFNNIKYNYEVYNQDEIPSESKLSETNEDEFDDDLFDDDQDYTYGNQQLGDISYGQEKAIQNSNYSFVDGQDYAYENEGGLSYDYDAYDKTEETIEEYEEQNDDDLFDDEVKNKVKVENIKGCYNKGQYELYYEKTPKTKRDIVRGMPRIWRASDTAEYLYKKQNSSDEFKKIFEEKDFNLYIFLKEELGKSYALDYLNDKLNFKMEYRLGYSKDLSIADNIKQYKIAFKQEKNNNVTVTCLSAASKLYSLYNKLATREVNNDKKEITNVNKDSNTMEQSTNSQALKKNSSSKSSKEKLKIEQESAIKNTWDTLSAVRAGFGQNHLDDINSVQEDTAFTANYSDDNNLSQENNIENKKYNNFFTKTKITAVLATLVLLITGGVGIKHLTTKKPGKINASLNGVINLDGLMDGNTQLAENTENTENTEFNYNPEVGSVLTLVQRDGSGNVTREFPLSSDKFDEGEKYPSSKCKGDLFKISSIIIYNKDSRETIDTISDKGIIAKSLYGKYGADIGIEFCLNACDENFNVIDETEHHLNYDEYSRFSNDTKQRIAESYSKYFAEETTENKTTEDLEENKKSEEIQTAENSNEASKETANGNESNNQNQTSYADSNNNAHLFNKDENGNIINACKWTSGSDGSGTTGSAELLDCDSYKFSLVVAREIVNGKSIIRKAVNVEKKNKSVEQIVNELYETYGNNIEIVYNFNGYKEGKLSDTYLGFISKKDYDAFNAEKAQSTILSEDDRFNREIENTLAQNEIFKGYKLTLHM